MGAFAVWLASRLGIGSALASVITWAALALAASGAAWGGYELIKHRGAAQVRTEIERQNNEAGIKGGEARLSRRDCNDRGGVHDFRRGVCTGLATGDRQ
jgi:hypothetical protein